MTFKITYFEGDGNNTPDRPFTKLHYVEWDHGGKFEYGWGEPPRPDEPTIPDYVRVQLALLIAPGLVVAKGAQG